MDTLGSDTDDDTWTESQPIRLLSWYRADPNWVGHTENQVGSKNDG